MAGKIFINYRRVESLKDAGHLHTQLLRHFPEKRLLWTATGLREGQIGCKCLSSK
jgi:hypothetical protein